MNPHEIDLHKELKKYFGFNQFKGLQEQVVKSIITGNNTFVIMPTGGGKSLCYQLPALVLEGTAIVVSPLIALMKNQVDAIRSLSSEQGIAHVLNSSLNKTEIAKVKKDITSGITKLLYVAPESLTKEEYIEFLENMFILFSKTYIETWEELMKDGLDKWLFVPKIQGSLLDITISRIAKETEMKNKYTSETINKAKEHLLKKYGKDDEE